MFGSHPLESDGVNPNLFYILAKENKKELKSCCINIPPTVLFEQGFAKAVFQTEPSKDEDEMGEVKRKAGRDVDLDDIFYMFAKNAQDGDICAVLMYASARTVELNNVRYLDKADLKKFLYVEIEKPKGLLQKFVKPKGSSNSMIHAVWSPLMVLTEGRRCKHSLTDRHLSVQLRAATFEDPKAQTVEVVVAQAIVKEIAKTCKTIADHFDKSEKLQLNRIGCYFKVDEKNQLQFLCSSSLRFVDNVTGMNNAPVSLNLSVKTPAKTKTKFAGEIEINRLSSTLDEIDKQSQSMTIGIPSLPDTNSLLLKGIHNSPSKQRDRQRARTNSPSTMMSRTGSRTPSSVGRKKGSAVASPISPMSPKSPSRSSPFTTPNQKSGGPLDMSGGLSSPTSRGAPSGFGNTSGLMRSSSSSGLHQSAAAAAAEQSQQLPPVGGDSKVMYIGKNTPVPQPAQLLRYQHMLPNSTMNMEASKKLMDIHRTENDIRSDWNSFLVEQSQNISSLKAQAAREKLEKQKEMQNEKIAAAVEKLESAAVPPVRIHSTFEEESPHAKHDEVIKTGDELAAEMAAQVTQEDRMKQDRQKGSLGDKETFMKEVKAAMGRKAFEDEKRKQKELGKKGSEDGDDEADGNDEFGREPMAIPQHALPSVSGMPRSTLLPPSIIRANALGASGSSGLGITRSGKVLGGNTSSLRPAPTPGPVLQSGGGMKSPSPKKGAGKAVTPSSTKKKASASTPSASPIAKKGSVNDSTASASMHPTFEGDSATKPVSSRRRQSTNLSFNALAGVGGDGAATPNRGTPMNSAFESGGNTPEQGYSHASSRRGSMTSIKYKHGGDGTLYGSVSSSTPTKGNSIFVEAMREKRSRIGGHKFEDFSALDADELEALEHRTVEYCSQFQQYCHELVYALYSTLLETNYPKAYLELPERFAPAVTPQVIASILHKLHPTVCHRAEYLSTTASSKYYGDLIAYRNEMLGKLHSGSLAQWPFVQMEPLFSAEKPPQDAMLKSPEPSSHNLASLLASRNNKHKQQRRRGSLDTNNNASVTLTDGLNISSHQAQLGLSSEVSMSDILLRTSANDRDIEAKMNAIEQLGADYCVVVPLLGERGFNILRSETTDIASEIAPYVDPEHGIVYHNAKKHLYFKRVAEIEGENEAAERRRKMEEAEAAARLQEQLLREGGSGAAGAVTNEKSLLGVEGQTSSGATPRGSMKGRLDAMRDGERLDANNNGDGEPGNTMDALGLRGGNRASPTSASAEICPRCNTCMICCVCSLVFSPKKGKKKL